VWEFFSGAHPASYEMSTLENLKEKGSLERPRHKWKGITKVRM